MRFLSAGLGGLFIVVSLLALTSYIMMDVYSSSHELAQQQKNPPTAVRAEYKMCADAFTAEQGAAVTCTFQICNATAAEVIINHHYLLSEHITPRCAWGRRLDRVPNLFADRERDENSRPHPISTEIMYPPSNFTETQGCEAWFFNKHDDASWPALVQTYVDLQVPTTGISQSIFYAFPSSTAGHFFQNNADNATRFLVIYACATRDKYNAMVTMFNIRQLRAALGKDAFIIVIDSVKETVLSDAEVSKFANVIIHADFISPGTFYDSAAMQEGILEAFRLFGLHLRGFGALFMLNDSVLGPLTNSFARTMTDLLTIQDQKILVVLGVWANVVIGGFGFMVNREAFLSATFTNYWRYTRFGCGKWGSIGLYEGCIHRYLMRNAGMRCYAFTNDIVSVAVPADQWIQRGLPFYKHKSSNLEAVTAFIRDFKPSSADSTTFFLTTLDPCAVA